MRTNRDFFIVAREFNNLRRKDQYSAEDIKNFCERVNLPVSTEYRAQLVERGILNKIGKGAYSFREKDVTSNELDQAFRAYRRKMAKFVKPKIVKAPRTVAVITTTEDDIQAAIKLLRSQRDRFLIYERK